MASIKTFTTGVVAGLKAVRCHFEPQQDLNGYDKPWPAGGGKNIWNPSAWVQSGTGANPVTQDGDTYTITWTNGALALTTRGMQVFPAGTYTISAVGTNIEYLRHYFYKVSDGSGVEHTHYFPATVTITEDCFIGIGGDYTHPDTAVTKIQLEQGNSVTSWTPYENLCPITGYDSVTVRHTGVNLCGSTRMRDDVKAAIPNAIINDEAKTVSFGYNSEEYPQIDGTSLFDVSFKPNTRYTLIITGDNKRYPRSNIRVVCTTATYVLPDFTADKTTYVWVLPANRTILRIERSSNGGTTNLYYEECGIFEGVLTAQDFEPYIGESATVEFGETAYGGSYELISGDLDKNWYYVDMGTLDWRYSESLKVFHTYSIPYLLNGGRMLCECYQPVMYTDRNFIDKSMGIGNTGWFINTIFAIDSAYTDAVAFKASVSGKKLCCQRRVSDTSSLTPHTMTAYRGLNNVWHDLNGDIDVDYIAKDHATPAEYRNKILLNTPHIEEQSGDVAAFSTDIKGGLKGAEVTLVPEQNLNGYNHPWPAGGGENIIPFDEVMTEGWTNTQNGLTATYSNGYMHITGTHTNTGWTNIVYISAWSSNRKSLGAGTYTNARGITLTCADYDGTGYKNASGTYTLQTGASVSGFYIAYYGEQTVDDTIPLMVVKGSTRPTTFSPYANICPITGHTSAKVYDDPVLGQEIEWNQLLKNADEWVRQQLQTEVTIQNGVITATLLSGEPSVFSPAITLSSGVAFTTIENHVYYLACEFKPATDGYPYVRNNVAFSNASPFGSTVTPAGQWGSYKNIVRVPEGKGGPAWYFGQGGVNTSSIAIGDSIAFKNMMCIDLTQMFGAGNEPSTVSEFQALFPASYYAYNTGEKTTVSAVNGEPCWEAEVELPTTGVNQWDEEWELGAYDVSTGEKKTVTNAVRCKNLIKVTPNTTYYRVAPSSWQIQSYGFQYCYYDENMTFLRGGRMYAPNSSTFTVPSDAYYMTFGSSDDSRMSVTTIEAGTISINYPASVTWYEPYETVTYGAKVNLATGECTVTDIRMHVSRATNMTVGNRATPNPGGIYFYTTLRGTERCSLSTSELGKAKLVEKYTHGTIENPYGSKGNYAWVFTPNSTDTTLRIGFSDEMGINSKADLNDWLDAQGGVDVSYPLETPRTFYLTPQELQQLRGQNNIFSPDGQIKVRYWTH